MPPTDAPGLRVLLAAGPDRSGVDELLEATVREARAGAPAAVLFSEEGLRWLDGPWPHRLHADGVRLSLCARSARRRRVDPAATPEVVRWSSLTTFLGDAAPTDRLWTALP